MYSVICIIIIFVCLSITSKMSRKVESYSYFRVWPILMVALFAAAAGILNSLDKIVTDPVIYIRLAGLVAILGWIGSIGASLGTDAAPFVRTASGIHKGLGVVLGAVLYPLFLAVALPSESLAAIFEGLKNIREW